jgi:hypothetical protein
MVLSRVGGILRALSPFTAAITDELLCPDLFSMFNHTPKESCITMKRAVTIANLLATFLLVAFASFTFAQDTQVATPRFAALPPHSAYPLSQKPAANLTQWRAAYTHKNVRYPFVMVGTNPKTTNLTTTVPVFIIPIKMVYGQNNGNMTFDPTVANFGTLSTVQMIQGSPILSSNVDFVQGGVDLGQTQYIDAYQRGNFWAGVKVNTNYHVLLGTPTVLATQTINVTPAQGQVITNPFLPGHKVAKWTSMPLT